MATYAEMSVVTKEPWTEGQIEALSRAVASQFPHDYEGVIAPHQIVRRFTCLKFEQFPDSVKDGCALKVELNCLRYFVEGKPQGQLSFMYTLMAFLECATGGDVYYWPDFGAPQHFTPAMRQQMLEDAIASTGFCAGAYLPEKASKNA